MPSIATLCTSWCRYGACFSIQFPLRTGICFLHAGPCADEATVAYYPNILIYKAAFGTLREQHHLSRPPSVYTTSKYLSIYVHMRICIYIHRYSLFLHLLSIRADSSTLTCKVYAISCSHSTTLPSYPPCHATGIMPPLFSDFCCRNREPFSTFVYKSQTSVNVHSGPIMQL